MRQLRQYGSGVLMIVAGVAFCVVLLLAPVADASAHDGEAGARRDFDRVVREIGAHYQVQPKSPADDGPGEPVRTGCDARWRGRDEGRPSGR